MSLRFPDHGDDGAGMVFCGNVKKLYVFEPAKRWYGAGGGYVVVASSFEEAVSMFPSGREHHSFVKEIDQSNKASRPFTWVLVATMETFERRSKVLMANWSYQ